VYNEIAETRTAIKLRYTKASTKHTKTVLKPNETCTIDEKKLLTSQILIH
jgi:hypothetical protein